VLLQEVIPLATLGSITFKTGGMQNFATIAWGVRYCQAHRGELHRCPLTNSMKQHLVYELRLLSDVIAKVSWPVARRLVGRKRGDVE
jgi:hypothetical protein